MFARSILSRSSSARLVLSAAGRRFESTAAAKAAETPASAAAAASASTSKAVVATKPVASAAAAADHGSSFVDRLASFLVGTGVGFGIGYFLLHDELTESNTRMEAAIASLNGRMAKLEKKN